MDDGRAFLAALSERVGSTIALKPPGPADSWSRGKITRPECIDTLTFRPVREGGRCARAFGYVLDDVCLCGKYQGAEHRGVVCEKCGVEVGSTERRATHFGHIPLATAVLHPWFRGAAATALGLSPESLEPMLAGESAGPDGALCGLDAMTARLPVELTLRELPVIPPRLRQLSYELGDPDADPDALSAQAVLEEEDPQEERLRKARARARALRGTDALYAEIVRRSAQLAKYIDVGAPTLLLRAEGYALQQAVDALFGPPSLKARRRNMRRLIDLLVYRLDEYEGGGDPGALDRTLQAALLSRASS